MELPATQARGRLTSLGAAIGGLRRRTWTGPGTTHPLLMCWAAATVGLLFVLRLRSTAPPQPSMTQIRVPPRVGNAPAYMTLRPVGGGGLTDSEIRMRRIGPRDDPNVLEGAAGDAVSSSTAEPITVGEGPWSDPLLLTGSGLPHGKLRYEVPGRLVAIGDVHGDRGALVRALRLARAVDEEEVWIGADLVILQTGDNLDRGDEELGVISLLRRLQLEAARAGGAVHVILGNHEIMNAELDFRFVADSGFDQFATFAHSAGGGFEPPVVYDPAGLPQKLPAVMLGRVAALRAGGTIAAAVLAERNVAIILRDTLFVHGGLLREHAERLEEINAIAASFLRGERQITDLAVADAVADENSMLWTRRWAFEVDSDGCIELGRTLLAANVTRLVIGHSVQPGGITDACDGLVYRIDIGMGASFAGVANRQMQILEITSAGTATTIKGPTFAEDADVGDRSAQGFW